MINKKWFSRFLKNVDLSTTKEITRLFPNSKFVVLKQEDREYFVYREIAFIYGSYILCSASNKIKKNNLVDLWTKKYPYLPFGRIFLNRKLKRNLIFQDNHSRKYNTIGEVEAQIHETFFDLDEIDVSVFCGKVFNSPKDLEIAKRFINERKSDLYIFPESYPFSRMNVVESIFPNGAVYGKYGLNGPETFFVNKNHIKIRKSTAFANEKLIMKKSQFPKIVNYNGIKIAFLICYDLLNPRISYYLTKKNIDLLVIPSMIPKKDVDKWKKFLYVRGQELQCPIVLTSNEDKRKICIPKILFYDNLAEKVFEYGESKNLKLIIGKNKLIESPKVHWSWLLKNNVFGPFIGDFD